MAAYAEGLNILRNANADPRRAKRRRDHPSSTPSTTATRSTRPRLQRLAARQRRRLVAARPDGGGPAPSPDLAEFAGRVSDSGEGRWTSIAAVERASPPRCSPRRSSRASLTWARRLRRQGAVGDAQGVRRARREAERVSGPAIETLPDAGAVARFAARYVAGAARGRRRARPVRVRRQRRPDAVGDVRGARRGGDALGEDGDLPGRRARRPGGRSRSQPDPSQREPAGDRRRRRPRCRGGE